MLIKKQEKWFVKDTILKIEGPIQVLRLILNKNFNSLKIDIATEDKIGEQNVELVKNYLSEYPLLKGLVLVLKQILYLSQLNDISKVD